MVSTAPTMAVLAKEAMKSMSDTLNTKEELEEFIKSMMKKIITKKKEEEKAAKPKVAKLEVEKLVKPPSKRKIFYDEMRVKIQDEFPELNPKQTEQKLADLWRIHVEELFVWRSM